MSSDQEIPVIDCICRDYITQFDRDCNTPWNEDPYQPISITWNVVKVLLLLLEWKIWRFTIWVCLRTRHAKFDRKMMHSNDAKLWGLWGQQPILRHTFLGKKSLMNRNHPLLFNHSVGSHGEKNCFKMLLAEKASQFHIRVPNGHGDGSLDKPGVWLSGWSGLFGGRFQDSNYGDRKSPRPGVVETPSQMAETPWLEKMAVILTTYCKCVFFFGRQHNPPWNWGSLEYWCLLGTRTCPCLFDGVEGSTGQLKLDWLVTSAHENLRGPHQIRVSSRNKALLRGYCPPWFVDNPLSYLGCDWGDYL